MINLKQHELAQELFQTLKTQFPEIELINISESPENPDNLWLNVTAPTDEEREIALVELAGSHTIDILIHYGYDICVMPRHGKREHVSLPQFSRMEVSNMYQFAK